MVHRTCVKTRWSSMTTIIVKSTRLRWKCVSQKTTFLDQQQQQERGLHFSILQKEAKNERNVLLQDFSSCLSVRGLPLSSLYLVFFILCLHVFPSLLSIKTKKSKITKRRECHSINKESQQKIIFQGKKRRIRCWRRRLQMEKHDARGRRSEKFLVQSKDQMLKAGLKRRRGRGT